MPICLNIGCGTDYKEGYINIDGSSKLFKTDKVVDLNSESLVQHFEHDSIDFILANDIIEHFYHWQAVRLLKDFYMLLKPSGSCEIRVPDSDYIINCVEMPLTQKLTLLYGGQDIAQGDNLLMNESRKEFPQYFCHKYGWTIKSMERELSEIGFSSIRSRRAGVNFITSALKVR